VRHNPRGVRSASSVAGPPAYPGIPGHEPDLTVARQHVAQIDKSVKAKYDPTGLFFVHHGVGSEERSADGFTRLN
jgi:hypothetical protein